MKIYIAGKITGDKDYRQKFRQAQERLEREGRVVLNPAEQPEGMTPADYMRICFAIANGVTAQEWISVKDRLPTIYDADADNCVLAIHKASNKRYYHWRSVADNPFDFTHWMKTPQPPKGE